MICVSTLSLPRCAIPITISSTLSAAPVSISACNIGIRASPPSMENRFFPMYLTCKNCSNSCAAINCLNRSRHCSALNFGEFKIGSMRCSNHSCWLLYGISVYSTATGPQYVCLSFATRSRNVPSVGPRNPPLPTI